MFGRQFKRQKANAPILTSTLNEPIEGLEKLYKMRVGYGLSIKWVCGIPLIWFSADIQIGKYALTPTGGIPAMTGSSFPFTPGSATCRLGEFDGTNIVDSGVDVTVWNGVPTMIAGNKLIQVKLIDGTNHADVVPC